MYKVKTKHPTEYNILIKVLERHPDFFDKTQNMKKVMLIRDKLNRKALKVIIVKDEFEEDISWRCAITAKHTSQKHELMSAMRSSVDEQILQFRKNNKNICVLCCNDKDLHVDHCNPQFDELASNFTDNIKFNNLAVPKILGKTNDNTHRRCFLEIDSHFKDEWVDYHYKNASLRMLYKQCNLSRSKTKKGLKM